MKFLHLNIIYLIIFIPLSCAKKDSTSSESSGNSFDGTYKTTCINDTNDNDSNIKHVEFYDNTYIFINEWDGGPNCQSMNTATKYTYTFSDDGTKTMYTGESVQKLKIIVSSVHKKMSSDSVTNSANNDSYCGITNWQKDVYRDVTGLVCGSSQMYNQGTNRITCFYTYNEGNYLKICDFSSSKDSNGYANYLQNYSYSKQ